jgi:hypothetical protein
MLKTYSVRWDVDVLANSAHEAKAKLAAMLPVTATIYRLDIEEPEYTRLSRVGTLAIGRDSGAC